MPETEADAEPDTGYSHSRSTTIDVDEERDSDIDSRPSETAKAKRITRQLTQLGDYNNCLLYTSPSPRDKRQSRMPSSA